MSEFWAPTAQLRITDADGLRITGFLTNTAPGGPARQLADLELRHRRHARVEDRILLRGFWTLSHDVARTG